jgi:NADH:ubiquinone oxidoreductase subunit 5 (subunit L)/multisubunit Na+/H+ antiporter MnhA subunit
MVLLQKKNQYTECPKKLYTDCTLILMSKECKHFFGPFCIIFLIISPNVISILLGWDGLGLVSYLLVIYYQNVKSYGAGMLTVLSNLIDVALMMVITWIINFCGWSFIYYQDINGLHLFRKKRP